GYRGGRNLLDVCRGQKRHQEKEPKVRGDVKVEIHKRMHQKPCRGHDSRKSQGSGKGKVILAEAGKGFDEQNREKPGTTETAEHTRFGKGFEVVVVRVIDNLAVIKRFVRRIHDLQRARSRAHNRVVQKDVPRAQAHGG